MAAPKSTPKDAQVMMAILKDMGVTDYEPRVINQMLEFTYRYVTDILDDAKVYSNHANKKSIDVEDVKLAIQCRLDHSFTTPPPRDLLMDVARHKNNNALPLIKPYTGPRLPPDRYCLASSNYRLKTLKKPRVQLQAGGGIATSLVTPRINIQQSGNRPGGLTLVTRTVSQPTVTVRTTPATPVIRVTPGAAVNSAQPTQTISADVINSLIEAGSLKRKREDDDDYDKP